MSHPVKSCIEENSNRKSKEPNDKNSKSQITRTKEKYKTQNPNFWIFVLFGFWYLFFGSWILVLEIFYIYKKSCHPVKEAAFIYYMFKSL
jgi:uncharacterized protein with PQ loop repeat